MTSSGKPFRDRACDHLAASLAARDTLADLYASRRPVAREQVAELHEAVRIGIKAAQVNALLAIEARLEALIGPGDVLAEVGLERVVS